MDKENNHYVYVYLDPRKFGKYTYDCVCISFLYEPIYVGRGIGKRYIEHLHDANNLNKHSLKLHKIRKIRSETKKEPIILLISIGMTLEDSQELEKVMIKQLGCIFNNSGPLTNLCEGGNKGPFGFKMNEEQKETRRQNCKDFWKNPEYRDKVITSQKLLWTNSEFRSKRSKELKEVASRPDVREKNKQAQLIAQNKPEHKNAMRELQKIVQNREEVNCKRRKCYKCFYIPTEQTVVTFDLKKFCSENNLGYFSMQNCVTGVQKQHKNWTCERLEKINAN